ncbi:hypothetical protein L21SP3_02266 [Sedimentisphaera cyanobacteriorum]|uniref:Uncharacterized protein n=1 Tax=Sedimentisphaera cyanobacteriorum TaxID=1940790 RepID=A0A1Q2HSZ4_9BACT|nr:hypothetical protein [Sedimentisphaera cyanobacteriorum]AQQ10434.1 hypothetical protein L21SP3_02266 [Sedimentisphaera cyanobacteriorum]
MSKKKVISLIFGIGLAGLAMLFIAKPYLIFYVFSTHISRQYVCPELEKVDIPPDLDSMSSDFDYKVRDSFIKPFLSKHESPKELSRPNVTYKLIVQIWMPAESGSEIKITEAKLKFGGDNSENKSLSLNPEENYKVSDLNLIAFDSKENFELNSKKPFVLALEIEHTDVNGNKIKRSLEYNFIYKWIKEHFPLV